MPLAPEPPQNLMVLHANEIKNRVQQSSYAERIIQSAAHLHFAVYYIRICVNFSTLLDIEFLESTS